MLDGHQDLLVEIGTEELPPLALEALSGSFAEGLRNGLRQRGIDFGDSESFASPRRIAVLIRNVGDRQPDRESLRRGPAVTAAFSADGSPTKAAEGFARSCGVSVSELDRECGERGEWLCHRTSIPGAPTVSLVPEIAEEALAGLPIPKRMRWGSGEAEFVRPVHWVCLLFGSVAIPGSVLGVNASGATRGHRFHHPDVIVLSHAADYAQSLRSEGWVEPSFERRRSMILDQVDFIAKSHGIVPEVQSSVLDEVTALVEWPCAILGEFDPEFLEVPAEVLIETMQKNQKYFPVRRSDGTLDSRFIAVANIESADIGQVRAGNERVIRPRFSDAKFFWEQDLSRPLESYFERLESVVFQERLGSVADKSRRIAALASALAERAGVSEPAVERAGLLCKSDLASSMVYEFPALQGTMGRYYATRSGEHPCVCVAMEEHYWPRGAGDRLPESVCGQLVATADRLDTLVGIFSIGQRPTGAGDPYGLRRASIGVLRIMIETPLELDLSWCLGAAAAGYPKEVVGEEIPGSVLTYMLERLVGYYQEQGIPADAVDSVLAVGDTLPARIDRRVRAVETFRSLPEGDSLAAANKRIRNILGKAGLESVDLGDPDPRLFVESAESGLWERVLGLEDRIAPLLERQDYTAVLARLAGLREDVDGFFEAVMVMDEDPEIRANRLALLARLVRLFLGVADISQLQ